MHIICLLYMVQQFVWMRTVMKYCACLSMLTGAEGRFDYIISNQKIIGIVDYAHTPDALENVLGTIKKLRKGYEQVITVVGCGGERDKTKRPVMATDSM